MIVPGVPRLERSAVVLLLPAAVLTLDLATRQGTNEFVSGPRIKGRVTQLV